MGQAFLWATAHWELDQAFNKGSEKSNTQIHNDCQVCGCLPASEYYKRVRERGEGRVSVCVCESE